MAVLLATSKNAPKASEYNYWCPIGKITLALDPSIKLPDLAELLFSATEEITGDWLELGKELAAGSGAELAHAPACAGNASDFGRMLTWTRVIEKWVAGSENLLVICDDAWMFRHLAEIPGIRARRAPSLAAARFMLFWRGYLARTKLSLELFQTAWWLRRQRRAYPQGAPSLLVYGHPNSAIDGNDGYFSGLMNSFDELCRVFHVDCKLERALDLTGDERNFSLHAWGNPFAALALPFVKWRPSGSHKTGPSGWLVRRAAALEGGTGQPAMIRWQQICHKAWLNAAKPRAVAWPWENHSWERDFVRQARTAQIRTIGYQHSTIGRQELNYSLASNPDGTDSLPEQILTSGAASRDILLKLGFPPERLDIGGSFRVRTDTVLSHDPNGPILLALPFDSEICAEMIEAIRPLGERGRNFLVKPHPMTPHVFTESPGVNATPLPLERQRPLAGVIFSATTVGLEAVLGGLPTFEFLSSNHPPMDVLPDGISVPSVTAETLGAALSKGVPPTPIDSENVFSRPNLTVWKKAFYMMVGT